MAQLEEFKNPEFQKQASSRKRAMTDKYIEVTLGKTEDYQALNPADKQLLHDRFANENIDKSILETGANIVKNIGLGAATNIDEYGASINKGLDYILPDGVSKAIGLKENQKYWNDRKETIEKNIDNKWAAFGGQVFGDIANLTPAGIVTKGTKAVRIAKSMLGGAAVGAGTTVAKNYGDDSLTDMQKSDETVQGAALVSALNGIIAGVSKGHITNAIKDIPSNADAAQTGQHIIGNGEHFGLSADEAISKPQNNLDQLEKGYKELETEIGGVNELQPKGVAKEPKSLEQQLQAKESFAKDSLRKAEFEKSVDNLDGVAAHEADANNYMQEAQALKEQIQARTEIKAPELDSAIQEPIPPHTPEPVIEKPLIGQPEPEALKSTEELLSHPRMDELLDMRQDVLAKDIQSPQKLVQRGASRELSGNGGTDKRAYDKAVYEKNYGADFSLTKSDVANIRAGKIDDTLYAKIESDLGVLDNNPDWALPQTTKPKEMSQADWDEANTLFSKGTDNLVAGTFAGIESDENGNISFSPEKFLLGLGGYTAVKAALKNKQVQGVLKEYAKKAVDAVDMNPAVHKPNGLNAALPLENKYIKNNQATEAKIKELIKVPDEDLLYFRGNQSKDAPNHSYQSAENVSSTKIIPQTPQQIKEIKLAVRNALVNKTNNKLELGLLDDNVSKRIFDATKLNLKGFSRYMDDNHIRHTLIEHGDAVKEAKRGQLPITEDDIAKIPDITSNFDKVTKSTITDKQGIKRTRLVFEKAYDDGTIKYVEAINFNPKKKEMSLKTMYKKGRETPKNSTEFPVTDLKSTHQSDGGAGGSYETIIPQTPLKEKSGWNDIAKYTKTETPFHLSQNTKTKLMNIVTLNEAGKPSIVAKDLTQKEVVGFMNEFHGAKAVDTEIPKSSTALEQNIKANGMHSMAGGFAGGSDSLINQRDYNGDGEYDYKDLLAGVAAGAISINALKKMAPKLFAEEATAGGVKIGAFDGDAFKSAKAKGYEHVRKIVSDESLKEWGDAANMFKRGFKDTLSAEYHKVREGATAAVNGQTMKLERLHNALKELSGADRDALHNFVAGESKTIDKALEPLAQKIKADIHALSSELVEKGVLTEEAFKEWEHHYIHRSYEKHFMGDVKSLLSQGFKIDEIFARGKTDILSAKAAHEFAQSINPELLNRPLKDGGLRLKNLPNGKVELRRDWTQAEREAMGEITDGAITIPETLMKLTRMVENAKLLEDASKLEGVVLQDGHKLTKEELDLNGYALAPNSGKYGVLAGKAVRKDVLDDIRNINNQIFNTFGADGALPRLWKGYLSTWKKSKTVWNVPSHVNNFMSNTFLMHLAGMGPVEITTALGRAGKMMVHGNAYEELLKKKMLGTATAKNLEDLAQMGEDLKYFIEAKEGGLLGRSDLVDVLSGQQNKLAGDGLLSKLDKFAQNSYHNGDSINRIAMYSHLRDKVGLDADEARRMVLTVMPDYSKPMPRAYQWMRDTGVAPFVSWSYYTMPAIYKMIKTKQGATQAVKALGALSALEWALTGGEITPLDNIPFMDTKKPNNMKMRNFAIHANGDDITTLKTDRWIPYIELLNPINFATSMFSGPPVKAVTNVLSSGAKNGMVDIYKWQPVTYKKDAGRFYDYFKYLTQSYVPLPAQAYTGWDIVESKLKDERKRKTNEVIIPRTPLQEVAKFGGLNSLDYSLRGVRADNKKN